MPSGCCFAFIGRWMARPRTQEHVESHTINTRCSRGAVVPNVHELSISPKPTDYAYTKPMANDKACPTRRMPYSVVSSSVPLRRPVSQTLFLLWVLLPWRHSLPPRPFNFALPPRKANSRQRLTSRLTRYCGNSPYVARLVVVLHFPCQV